MLHNIKGAFGYINKKKKQEILKVAVAFALVVAIFLVGTIITGSRKNIFSVIAILGVLPASNLLVRLIALFPYRSMQQAEFERIRQAGGTLRIFFDFVFTSDKGIFPVASIAVCSHTVCGYMKEKTELLPQAEEHLKRMMRAEGFQKMSLKLYDKEDAYLKRLEELQSLDASDDGKSNALEQKVGNLFMNISL